MTEKNGDLKYKTDNAIDEAYRRGYEDGLKDTKSAYNEGLNDAWECARKLCLNSEDGGYHSETIKEIFNLTGFLEGSYDVIKDYSASEAMQKIMDYEEPQTETETWISMDKSRKITVPKGTFEKILSDADAYDI